MMAGLDPSYDAVLYVGYHGAMPAPSVLSHTYNPRVVGDARIGGTANEPSDVTDIVFLVRHLKLKSAKDVLDLVGQYCPANRIPVKTQYLVEGLFEEGKI